ncbi:MAG: hypothetical protein V1865_00855 [bacterium]
MSKFKIAVVLYTYDRTDDAKVNMDIITSLWQSSKIFSSIKIVHAFNGQRNWYPKKYKEDDLIRLKNPGHFQGASELIDAGIKKIQDKYKDVDYVVVLAPDTWLVKLNYLENIFKKMAKDELYLATCAWDKPDWKNIFEVGMAVDFFVFDFKWAKKYKMFPTNYKQFYDKYSDLFLYFRGSNVSLEKLIFSHYIRGILKQYNDNNGLKHLSLEKMLRLTDREPIHKDTKWTRQMYWPKMGLLTHHDIKPKKALLVKVKNIKGESIKKLLASKNVDYFNKH